jgi:hypothetical protein
MTSRPKWPVQEVSVSYRIPGSSNPTPTVTYRDVVGEEYSVWDTVFDRLLDSMQKPEALNKLRLAWESLNQTQASKLFSEYCEFCDKPKP